MYRVTIRVGTWRAELEVAFRPATAMYTPRAQHVVFCSAPDGEGRRRSCLSATHLKGWRELLTAYYHAFCWEDTVEAEIVAIEEIDAPAAPVTASEDVRSFSCFQISGWWPQHKNNPPTSR